MVRLLVCLVCLVGLAAIPRAWADAPADAVALLPLDADRSLEIYGQPVASEIARALVAGKVDVVVVGPRMAVPERARLIVDGTITAKGDTVVLSIRVRNPRDGSVLVTLSSIAHGGVATIDQAAADLSARVLPAVVERLAALHAPEVHETHDAHPRVAVSPTPAIATPRPMLVAVTAPAASSEVEPLRAALVTTVEAWSRAHGREPVPTDPARLTRAFAANTVAASSHDLAIVLEVTQFAIAPGPVPSARASVHVRIADAHAIVFERTVVTDTVVGDKGLVPAALAARTAREVLDILRPHLRRAVPGWR